MKLHDSYKENIELMRSRLHPDTSFDMIERRLIVGDGEMTMYYIDGFVKDAIMQRLMQFFLSLKTMGSGRDAAAVFADSSVPYVEVERTEDEEKLLTAVLSGSVIMLGSSFGAQAIIIDARTYPARDTEEPDTDKVMQGSHDGFVETLIFNTALIRRRLRDPALTMKYVNMGGESRTDVVMCYMDGKADSQYVERITKLLEKTQPKSLTLGYQSLAESLIRRRWYNPFPKIRTTERPDVAAAEIVEGSVLIICDNSPQVMILPTSIFDFLQETDDYYFPPLTGCYLRLIRHFVFWLSLFLTPVWYLFLLHPEWTAPGFAFIIPEETGEIPIILQLFLVEFAVDGLQLASMNTPSMLANSLSVIGGLILGDFAVTIGWIIPEVILYMAIVSIGTYTQPNHELGYAFKFLRMMLLVLTAIFDVWGFAAGMVLILILLCTNSTIDGRHNYLYPVVPFNGKALARLFFRLIKEDVKTKKS